MNADENQVSPEEIEGYFGDMFQRQPDLEYIVVDPIRDSKDPRIKIAVDYAVEKGWLTKFFSIDATDCWGPGTENSSGILLRYRITHQMKDHLLRSHPTRV